MNFLRARCDPARTVGRLLGSRLADPDDEEATGGALQGGQSRGHAANNRPEELHAGIDAKPVPDDCDIDRVVLP